MRWVIPLLVACTSTTSLGQSVISDGDAEESISISYADLNLGQAKDLDRLMWRIKGAAASICFEGSHEPLNIEIADRACFESAVGNARRQVDQAVAHRSDTSVLAAARVIVVRAR